MYVVHFREHTPSTRIFKKKKTLETQVLAFNTPSKSFVCGSANELSEACLWWRVCGGLVFESLVEIPKVTLHLIRNELLFDNFMGLAIMWLIAYVLVDTHKTGLKLVVGT